MRNNQDNYRAGRRNNGYNSRGKFYESNGPDVRVRGTASNIAEKYQQLARDAHISGDLVTAEAYQQYAEPIIGWQLSRGNPACEPNAERCLSLVYCQNCSSNAPFAKLKMLAAERP
jgi:Domain of unknown function (DUF4167)